MSGRRGTGCFWKSLEARAYMPGLEGVERSFWPQPSPNFSQVTFSCSWSFVWSTLGVTSMAFVTGALGFWAPKFLFEARVIHGLQVPDFQEPGSSQDR